MNRASPRLPRPRGQLGPRLPRRRRAGVAAAKAVERFFAEAASRGPRARRLDPRLGRAPRGAARARGSRAGRSLPPPPRRLEPHRAARSGCSRGGERPPSSPPHCPSATKKASRAPTSCTSPPPSRSARGAILTTTRHGAGAPLPATHPRGRAGLRVSIEPTVSLVEIWTPAYPWAGAPRS